MFIANLFTLDRAKNPVFARELSRYDIRKPFVAIITSVVYASYFAYCIFVAFVFIRHTPSFPYDVTIQGWMGSRDFVVTYDITLSDWHSFVFRALNPVFVMVYLAIPALAATSIVSERRRQTLMPVQLSLLRPFDIVWAKVVAPIVPILFPTGVYVVTLALVPLWHERFLLPSASAISLGLAYIVSSAFIASAVSVLISTFAKSSATAVTLSYGMLIMIMPFFGSKFFIVSSAFILDVVGTDDLVQTMSYY